MLNKPLSVQAIIYAKKDLLILERQLTTFIKSVIFLQEFEEWKATIEDLQSCSYVKTTGVKVSEKEGDHVQYFSCNRCGMYRPTEKGMRLTKSQGIFVINIHSNESKKVQQKRHKAKTSFSSK